MEEREDGGLNREGGGLNREGGLVNFPPLKGGGGLNRGFTVFQKNLIESKIAN